MRYVAAVVLLIGLAVPTQAAGPATNGSAIGGRRAPHPMRFRGAGQTITGLPRLPARPPRPLGWWAESGVTPDLALGKWVVGRLRKVPWEILDRDQWFSFGWEAVLGRVSFRE